MKTYVYGIKEEPYKVTEDTLAKCLQGIKDHYIAVETESIHSALIELDNADIMDASDIQMYRGIIEECTDIMKDINNAKTMAALETVLQTIYDCNINIVEEKFNIK